MHNDEAARYCKELNLLPIGSSDSHHTKQLGKYATWIPDSVTTVEDLVQFLKKGVWKPAIWTPDGYVCPDNWMEDRSIAV